MDTVAEGIEKTPTLIKTPPDDCSSRCCASGAAVAVTVTGPTYSSGMGGTHAAATARRTPSLNSSVLASAKDTPLSTIETVPPMRVGAEVGLDDGIIDGCEVGEAEGFSVGWRDGLLLGLALG